MMTKKEEQQESEKLRSSQEKTSSPGKYSFLSALEELEQFKTVTDELFFKRMRDLDAEMGSLQGRLRGTFSDLDGKLTRVIMKHEHQYNEAYKIMLKRKEADLQILIERVREKLSVDIVKDEKIKKMEMQTSFIRKEAIRLDKACKVLRDQAAKLRSQLDVVNTDNKFLKQQVLDLNKQNKALKFTLSRLQAHCARVSNKHTPISDASPLQHTAALIDNIVKTENLDLAQTIDQINLSMHTSPAPLQNQSTQNVHIDPIDTAAKSPPLPAELQNFSQKAASAVFQTLELTEAEQSQARKARSVQAEFENVVKISSTEQKRSEIKFSEDPAPSIQQIQASLSITPKLGPVVPVQNLKFRSLVQMLFSAGLCQEEMMQELVGFVDSLEGKLNEQVDEMRERLQREKRKVRQLKANIPAARAIDKNEFQELFFECVECVRKEVARRKLKGEMLSKRVFMNSLRAAHRSMADTTAMALLTEERLARLEELKPTDRIKILDLFVHDEKILTRIFDLVFPSATWHKPQRQSMSNSLLLEEDIFMRKSRDSRQSCEAWGKPEFSNPKVSQSIRRAIHTSGGSRFVSPGNSSQQTSRRPLPVLQERGEKKEAWRREERSVEEMQALEKEMERKKIRANVYLKSGLLGAMRHKKDYFK